MIIFLSKFLIQGVRSLLRKKGSPASQCLDEPKQIAARGSISLRLPFNRLHCGKNLCYRHLNTMEAVE